MSQPTQAAAEALQLEALLLARLYLYTLFHKAFGGEPSGELVVALASNAALDAFDEYADGSPSLAAAAAFLRGLRDQDADTLAGEVSGEYTRLFLGPGRPEAFPIESPYRTGEATYFQENTLMVRAAFRAAGFEPKRVGHVPDDHVSLLCAFMAETAARSLVSLRASDRAGLAASLRGQQAFADGHLGWLGEFAAAARRGATARLYPQLAEALADFVRVDRVFLGEAALWAEDVSPYAPAERPSSFAEMEGALEALRGLRLRGLEENEIRSLSS